MSITLELNQNESELLVEILEERLGTLREQVYHSEAPDFRDHLKAKEALLKGLLEHVRSAERGIPTRSAAL